MADLKTRLSLVVGAVAWALVLVGCGGGYQADDGNPNNSGNPNGAGPGRRAQSLALTPEQELKLGNEAFQQAKEQYPEEGGAPLDHVRTVGEKIFHVALDDGRMNQLLRQEINLHVAGWHWDQRDYAVLKSDQINAFCLPGGKVCVYTGLLSLTEKERGPSGKDDWLATVLGHEIAHALAHHASERVAREHMYAQSVDAMSGYGALSRDDQHHLTLALGGLGGKLGELAFDRQQESEADHIGVFLMTFAGYDPAQSVVFWRAMEQASGGGHLPEILSDHPSDARRIAQLQGWAASAENAKRAWQEGRVAQPTDR